MSSFSIVAVIYNPNSTGAGKELAVGLEAHLHDAGVTTPTELIETEHAGHAIDLAYELAHKYEHPLIISSSGDGGYSEVINGALRAQDEGASPVCAVLAAGNANDHSHVISDSSLLELIINERISKIDVLTLDVLRNGEAQPRKYAHSYIGLGLTPTVAVELNKTKLNKIRETFIVYKSLRALQPVVIQIDGDEVSIDSLVVSNIDRMAKVLTMADNARPDDGSIKVTMLPSGSKFALLKTLVRAMTTGLRGTPAKTFEFTAVKEMVMQADGEVLELRARDHVSIGVAPAKLATLR